MNFKQLVIFIEDRLYIRSNGFTLYEEENSVEFKENITITTNQIKMMLEENLMFFVNSGIPTVYIE